MYVLTLNIVHYIVFFRVNTLTFNLMRRNPSDTVSGLLMFTVNIENTGKQW